MAGGRIESDERAVTAALREAWEEVSLPRHAVDVWGTLPASLTAVWLLLMSCTCDVASFMLHDAELDCVSDPDCE